MHEVLVIDSNSFSKKINLGLELYYSQSEYELKDFRIDEFQYYLNV